jgi:hypothetical protein
MPAQPRDRRGSEISSSQPYLQRVTSGTALKDNNGHPKRHQVPRFTQAPSPCVSAMEFAMDVTLERPVASVRTSISVWFAGIYAALIAARQAQANARIAQHLKDLGLEAPKGETEN